MSLLPVLVPQFVRGIPDCAAPQLSGTAEALARLRSLDAGTSRAIGARFAALLVPGPSAGAVELKHVAKLLDALQRARCEPGGELLARVAEWVAAAGAADAAAGVGQAGPGRARALHPPGAAARLLRAWCFATRREELPMSAVWALARGAAEGACAAGAGFAGQSLSATLHALASHASKATKGAGDATGAACTTPSDLHGPIAKWGGLAIARIVPEDAWASKNLAWSVTAMFRLRVAPDAATAACAAAKTAAVAKRVQSQVLPLFALHIIPPLVAWHKQGLVPDLALTAKALAARAADWAAACTNSNRMQSCKWALKLLMNAAQVSMPCVPVPCRELRQEGSKQMGKKGEGVAQSKVEQSEGKKSNLEHVERLEGKLEQEEGAQGQAEQEKLCEQTHAVP